MVSIMGRFAKKIKDYIGLGTAMTKIDYIIANVNITTKNRSYNSIFLLLKQERST